MEENFSISVLPRSTWRANSSGLAACKCGDRGTASGFENFKGRGRDPFAMTNSHGYLQDSRQRLAPAEPVPKPRPKSDGEPMLWSEDEIRQ